jgi:hypothetical protein
VLTALLLFPPLIAAPLPSNSREQVINTAIQKNSLQKLEEEKKWIELIIRGEELFGTLDGDLLLLYAGQIDEKVNLQKKIKASELRLDQLEKERRRLILAKARLKKKR